MKILHISGANRNDAGVIAFTLHTALKNKGHQSKLLVPADAEKDGDVITMYSPLQSNIKRCKLKIERYFRAKCLRMLKKDSNLFLRLNPDYCPHSISEAKAVFSSESILKKFPFRPDIVILYFLNGFVNAQNISDIYSSTKAKILWLLPDMAAMTGGCHYAWGCEGYKELCGCCPAIFSDNYEDITRQNMLFKQQHLKSVDITILAGTEWIYRQVTSSMLFENRKIERIMVPVDEDVFKPGDKTDACEHFRISSDKKVIFFGAQYLWEKRKGIRYLLDSLKILKREVEGTFLQDKIHLLIAGSTGIVPLPQLTSDYTFAGLLSVKNELPKAFQAADLFVCPSIEDAGPMMVNQAIMSGTPVVAFEMGVALDLVHTGVTGYRARLKDSDDLAKGMKNILSLSPTDLNKMRENCRQLGLAHTTSSVQVERLERILMER